MTIHLVNFWNGWRRFLKGNVCRHLCRCRVALLLCACMAAMGGYGQARRDSLSQRLSAYMAASASLGRFNGNVWIAQRGRVLLDQTYLMPTEVLDMQVTRRSRFVIASVSKVFIHYGILKLVAMHKLSLGDPLSTFFPDFPQGDKITIDHLLHHQSGLPRELTNYELYDHLTLVDVVTMAKREKLEFEPGTQTHYSNVGFFLLHAIIDQVAPSGYDAFMQHQILRPLGLRHTAEYNRAKSIPHFAVGHDLLQGKVVASDQIYRNRFETGNYVSTIGDMARFGKRLLRGKVIAPELAMEMFATDSLLEQAGGRPGYRAYFYHNLKTDVLFLFLANYTDIPIQAMTADVVRILQGEPVALPRELNRQRIMIDDSILQRYVGSYALEADATNRFALQVADGGLLFVDGDGSQVLVYPDTETTFFEDPTSADGLEFVRNAATGLYELTLISSGLRLRALQTE